MLELQRPEELRAKVETVETALANAGIAIAVEFQTGSDDDQRFGYRNRLRMKVLEGRADFFNQAKRDGCPVVRPDLWSAIERLRMVATADPELLSGIDHLEVRIADHKSGSAEPLFGLSLSSRPVGDDIAALSAALGPNWVIGDPSMAIPPTLSYVVDPVNDISIEVPVTSFVQVNSTVNRQLVAEVLRIAETSGAATFLDLYSGAGNFSVPLAAKRFRGTAVESAGPAIEALSRSEAAISGALRCIGGDARAILEQLEPADLVIADPPRAGLQVGYGELAALVGETLVLIGCNATSFAKDLAQLTRVGLNVESVLAFDMFPGTNHVETLAVLRASSC